MHDMPIPDLVLEPMGDIHRGICIDMLEGARVRLVDKSNSCICFALHDIAIEQGGLAVHYYNQITNAIADALSPYTFYSDWVQCLLPHDEAVECPEYTQDDYRRGRIKWIDKMLSQLKEEQKMTFLPEVFEKVKAEEEEPEPDDSILRIEDDELRAYAIELMHMVRCRIADEHNTFICGAIMDVVGGNTLGDRAHHCKAHMHLKEAADILLPYIERNLGSYSFGTWRESTGSTFWHTNRELRLIWIDRMIYTLEESWQQ